MNGILITILAFFVFGSVMALVIFTNKFYLDFE